MAAGGINVRKQSFDTDKSTPKWVTIAKGDIGTREAIGDDKPNPIVQKWVQEAMGNTELVDVTSDDHPWCAHFVGAKLVESGYPSSRSGMARSYMRYGDPVDKGNTSQWKAGDIVVFWRGKSNDGVTGHVAFLLSWDATYVYVLGGNQGDKVSIMRNGRSKILAIRRPRSLLQLRTVQSTIGSVASQGAAKGVQTFVPDGTPDLITAAHADTLSSNISGISIDPSTAPQMPSPEDLQAAYDQAHPYMTMMQHIKPELIIVFTAISLGLAAYAGYRRYQDWKQGHNT